MAGRQSQLVKLQLTRDSRQIIKTARGSWMWATHAWFPSRIEHPGSNKWPTWNGELSLLCFFLSEHNVISHAALSTLLEAVLPSGAPVDDSAVTATKPDCTFCHLSCLAASLSGQLTALTAGFGRLCLFVVLPFSVMHQLSRISRGQWAAKATML